MREKGLCHRGSCALAKFMGSTSGAEPFGGNYMTRTEPWGGVLRNAALNDWHLQAAYQERESLRDYRGIRRFEGGSIHSAILKKWTGNQENGLIPGQLHREAGWWYFSAYYVRRVAGLSSASKARDPG